MTSATEAPLGPRPLDPRVLRLWRIQAALASLVALVLLGGGVLAVLVADGPVVLAVGFGLLLVVTVGALLVAPGLQFARWRYEVGEEGLVLEHGVISWTSSTTPYRRIQHVDIASGPLERLLGLGHLVLHTASASSDAEVPGIPLDEADDLRTVILSRAGAGDAV